MKTLLTLLLFLALSLPARAQSGNRVLVLTGTNTTTDWQLQRELTWSLTGPSTNTHVNVTTSATIKNTALLRVVSPGALEVQFVFPGGITTNWPAGFLAVPRVGITYYLFEQYATTVDITPDPAVYPTANGQVFRQAGGTNGFGNVNLADPDAVGTTILDVVNGGTGVATSTGTGSTVLSANPVFTGNVDVSQGFLLSGDITPSQITSDQNNYNPTGLSTASRLRLDSDAARNITGIIGQQDGRILIINNIGANNISLVNGSGSSLATNRFGLSTNLVIAGGQGAILNYDLTSGLWRAPAAQSSASSSGTATNGGFSFAVSLTAGANPGDNVTYNIGAVNNSSLANSTTFTNVSLKVPYTCTITNVWMKIFITGTLGTTESIAHTLSINDSAGTAVFSGAYDQLARELDSGVVAISVTAGDHITIKANTTPSSWATNPTTVSWFGRITGSIP